MMANMHADDCWKTHTMSEYWNVVGNNKGTEDEYDW